MWDAFLNDPDLASIKKKDVNQAMAGDANLRLCRDYANTAKHLNRRSPSDVVAAVLEAGSTGTGNFVIIGYGPAAHPQESTIDALELANAAYGAWQRFMDEHGIDDHPAVTTSLLDPQSG